MSGSTSDRSSVLPDEEPEEDFATMLAEMGLQELREVETGEIVQGTVVSISSDAVFVDIGAKSEALVERGELLNDQGELTVQEGSTIEAYVVEVSEGEIRLSQSLARRAQSRQLVLDAQRSGVPVEGRVEESVKGGFRVALGGGILAFCPISQIDIAFTEDPAVHVGQTYRFTVTRVDDGERNVIVSRRRLLEAEREAQAEETRRRLEPGARFWGEVRTLKPYGAFVDVGGVEGLLHVSELSHVRVQDPAEMLQVGQSIEVEVKSYEPENDRLSLTRKPLEEDPWELAQDELDVGDLVQGTITKLMDFGAFVQLIPGVEGLLHVSELAAGRRVRHPSDIVSAGDQVRVRIDSIDFDRRRISLVRVFGEEIEKVPPLEEGSIYQGIVDDHTSFGVFVVLPAGLGRGLLPREESGFAPGTDLSRELPAGSTVEVEVIGIEEKDGRKRIRLSRETVEKAREREALERYSSEQKGKEKEVSAGMGNLGELLQAKGFRLKSSQSGKDNAS